VLLHRVDEPETILRSQSLGPTSFFEFTDLPLDDTVRAFPVAPRRFTVPCRPP